MMDEADLASLYTPIGLDLDGGSPYQIAHSIVGEVLAADNERTPHHLREREGHIHDRVDDWQNVGSPVKSTSLLIRESNRSGDHRRHIPVDHSVTASRCSGMISNESSISPSTSNA